MKSLISTVCLMLTALTLSWAAPAHAGQNVYDFKLDAIEGGVMPLSQFNGKPLLLVNTASFCGFTYQYEALQALWDEYRERGLVVLGVPSNDFGRQEPGSAQDIQEFCEVNFAITFPMSDKVQVTGPGTHPLFAHIRDMLGPEAGPQWNFNKYLIDGQGRVLEHWPSSVQPDDPRILSRIEGLLAGS